MFETFRNNRINYLIEAAGLGVFMVSASVFATILYHPDFTGQKFSVPLFLRDCLMGAAMGLTAIAIIYSPFGKRSGAHINPSTTLTFFRLGKIHPHDALFYVLFQFAGGLCGVILSSLILGKAIGHPYVNYVVTIPGKKGFAAAFIAETFISFLLMTVVLNVSNKEKLSHLTGVIVGILVMVFITFEAPLSGMSINPARTFASALPANVWKGIWIYFIAPPLGMLLAAEAYCRFKGKEKVACAKLHHKNKQPCIFCEYQSAVRHQQSAVSFNKEQSHMNQTAFIRKNSGRRTVNGGRNY
jgi:aquaporin Z